MTKYEVITQDFVNSIYHKVREVTKISTIKAKPLTNIQTVLSKEGPELGMPGDFLVTENNGAAANYIIKKETFLESHILIQGNIYQKVSRTFAYKLNKPFSIIPSWNNGIALNSEEHGGYLIINSISDFNICSFKDFAKTYTFS
ncbi:hypothetical protein CN918_27990 [Priestia megaterium]|nr:hypothetical protein CN918_27990 [Priestia megaterium]